MQGRYGTDSLNKLLFTLAVACFILSFLGLRIFSRLYIILMVVYLFRSFSKNYNSRYRENQIFLQHTEGLRKRFDAFKTKREYKKTHRIFTCPKCKKKLSVPKGKGKIEISCPCGNKLKKKT